MRGKGRIPETPIETLKEAVKEYNTTDKSAREVGAKYGVKPEVLRYHAKKERDKMSGTFE